MLRSLKMLGGAAIALVLAAAPAQAAPVIDFQTGGAGAGGTITWDGTNLVGNNIPIGLANIFGAPENNGSFVVSGLVSAQNGATMWGDLDFNTSADNNFITLSGCIGQLGIGGFNAAGQCVAPVPLLNGTFTSFLDGPRGLIAGSGPDVKSVLLLDAIDFNNDLPWEFFGFSITVPPGMAPGGSATVISTDIVNAPVPEPATMMLVGAGLLAAFRARSRRQQA